MHYAMNSIRRFYANVVVPNLGVSLLLLSQFLNSVMVLTCKLLESEAAEPFSPVQILFARMFVTYVCCMVYMAVTGRVENAPFGPIQIRTLLVLRGGLGFFGVFGLYFSLQYLSLSDAVLITFLIPMVTAFLAWVLIGEHYSLLEGACAVLSLGSVLLIAKPDFLFGHEKTNHLRMVATGMGLVGVLGASLVYIVLRKIGTQAHPLILVSYFALITCMLTLLITLVVPGMSFRLPGSLSEWLLFSLIGFLGFFMQFCLAAGLQLEKALKSALMIYTNMVFALFWDLVVWHQLPDMLSVLGTSVIIGCAYVVIRFKPTVEPVAEAKDVSLEEFILDDESL